MEINASAQLNVEPTARQLDPDRWGERQPEGVRDLVSSRTNLATGPRRHGSDHSLSAGVPKATVSNRFQLAAPNYGKDDVDGDGNADSDGSGSGNGNGKTATTTAICFQG